LTGGPFTYTGLPLSEAHTRFHLTSEEFDEVGAEIVRALDYYNVPEREKKQLVDAYMLSKPDVVAVTE
jgi:hemoglobin